MLDCRTLAHQNSSLPWPQEEIVKMARSTLRGRTTLLIAVVDGRMKRLGWLNLPLCEEMGIISDAASGVSLIVKNDAVSVVLNKPV